MTEDLRHRLEVEARLARACPRNPGFATLSPHFVLHFIEFRPFQTKCGDKVQDKVGSVLLLGQALDRPDSRA